MIPDSIASLRDSVAVVADSIRADQVETATAFDPKFNSTYTEAKDVFTWSKHLQFGDYFDLPRRTPTPLEMALARCPESSVRKLESHGWRIVDAVALSTDLEPYRAYIRAARGEFGVAKDQYTRLGTGWFSDRSACFLAAGRPVVAQETGFSRVLPCGRGLFAFEGPEAAAAALAEIESDYPAHCRAAEEIAREFFDAERVVASLLERAGF